MRKFGIILLVCCSLFLFVGCGDKKVQTEEKQELTDGEKFKKEYEQYNKYVADDGTKEYPQVTITEDNKMKYSSFKEVKEILKDGTGVVFFGNAKSAWTRNVVPILIESAKEVGVDTIYYYDHYEDRDEKHLDSSGNVVIDKEGSEEYQELVTILYSELGPYEGLNNDTIKRLYYPTVVFVSDGLILGSHIGTIESQTDPKVNFSSAEQEELKEIYTHYMELMQES